MTTSILPQLNGRINGAAELDRARILVVDDDSAVRSSVAAALESDGFEVGQARSGREAVGLFRSEPWDAVLLDVGMPDGDGWEAAERIGFIDPGIPIVVVTGRPSQAHQARELGVAALVEKPVNFHKLTNLLRHLLERPEGAASVDREPHFTFVARR